MWVSAMKIWEPLCVPLLWAAIHLSPEIRPRPVITANKHAVFVISCFKLNPLTLLQHLMSYMLVIFVEFNESHILDIIISLREYDYDYIYFIKGSDEWWEAALRRDGFKVEKETCCCIKMSLKQLFLIVLKKLTAVACSPSDFTFCIWQYNKVNTNCRFKNGSFSNCHEKNKKNIYFNVF